MNKAQFVFDDVSYNLLQNHNVGIKLDTSQTVFIISTWLTININGIEFQY